MIQALRQSSYAWFIRTVLSLYVLLTFYLIYSATACNFSFLHTSHKGKLAGLAAEYLTL